MFRALDLITLLIQQFAKYKWRKLNKLTLKIEPIIFTTIKLIEKILMRGC